MSPTFDFVISVENSHYMAWQAMLFHYSCLEQTGRAPIIVVHGDESPLLPEFELIKKKGGRIQRARNFRHDGGVEYAVRNTAGTLCSVQADADFLIICDPDFVFLAPPSFDRYCVARDAVSVDEIGHEPMVPVHRVRSSQDSRPAASHKREIAP